MERLREIWERWNVQVALVGGAIVIATAYGTCTYDRASTSTEDSAAIEVSEVSAEVSEVSAEVSEVSAEVVENSAEVVENSAEVSEVSAEVVENSGSVE